MTTLEKKAARYRRLSEIVTEIAEALAPIKAEMQQLEGELLEIFSGDPKLYNVCICKSFGAGFVANDLVQFYFNKKLERKNGKRDDDQEWLAEIAKSQDAKPYVRSRLELAKSKLRADLAAGLIDEKTIGGFGLRLATTANLKVTRARTVLEMDVLRTRALDAAAEAEDATT